MVNRKRKKKVLIELPLICLSLGIQIYPCPQSYIVYSISYSLNNLKIKKINIVFLPFIVGYLIFFQFIVFFLKLLIIYVVHVFDICGNIISYQAAIAVYLEEFLLKNFFNLFFLTDLFNLCFSLIFLLKQHNYFRGDLSLLNVIKVRFYNIWSLPLGGGGE